MNDKVFDEEVYPERVDPGYDEPTIVKVKVPMRKRLGFNTRMEYDGLNQREFFYMCIDAYLNNFKAMRELVNRYKLRVGKIDKDSVKFEKEQLKAGEQKEKTFFSEKDLQSIFSVIENDDRVLK